MTKILFNENNTDVFNQYSAYLARYGFETSQLVDLQDWQQYSNASIVIIDGEIKDLTKCLPEIRGHYQGGIVVSTKESDDATQIISLELGADDVVARSAKPRMVAAKLNALLRRIKSSETTFDSGNETIQIGGLVVNKISRKIELNGLRVGLTSHEFELLVMLAQNAGRVVDRNTLFEQILGRPYDGLGRSIDVRVSKLRKKLGDNETSPEMIKTVWKQGYCLIPDAF
ncbi:winged helix-turn-helix domain-containing protein [Pseudoalteromonas xiamenensis]|uniref:winged helix-turn-helix domain-containing protein n=1 Tax=Pseudoalteromonas xiamenensis TaxID=882626 RepID=UPI0035E9A2EF